MKKIIRLLDKEAVRISATKGTISSIRTHHFKDMSVIHIYKKANIFDATNADRPS